MSYWNSSKGYIAFGKQTARTTGVTPTRFVRYITEDIGPEIKEEVIREGGYGKYEKLAIKNSYAEKVNLSFYARPTICGFMLGALMGTDTVTTLNTTVKIHTMTFNATDLTTTPMQKWLTVEKLVSSNFIHRGIGCKINALTFEGEAGKPIKVTAEGNGINTAVYTTSRTVTYESNDPFCFYDGVFMVNASSTTYFDIKSFNFKLTTKNDLIQTTGLTHYQIFNNQIEAEVTFGLLFKDFTLYKKANYAAGSAASASYSEGKAIINFATGTGSTARRMQFTMSRVRLKPHNIQLDPNNKTLEQPFSGVVMTPLTTTTFMTALIHTNVATAFPI